MKSRGKGGRIRVVAIPVWVMQDIYARTSAVGSVKTHSSKKQEVKQIYCGEMEDFGVYIRRIAITGFCVGMKGS